MTAEYELLPPTTECEARYYCPFTDNGAYHGVCLWHEGPERTCTCDGQIEHNAMTLMEAKQEAAVEAESCDHPREAERVDVYRNAVPRDHPGYKESRRTTCTRCGRVETT